MIPKDSSIYESTGGDYYWAFGIKVPTTKIIKDSQYFSPEAIASALDLNKEKILELLVTPDILHHVKKIKGQHLVSPVGLHLIILNSPPQKRQEYNNAMASLAADYLNGKIARRPVGR